MASAPENLASNLRDRQFTRAYETEVKVERVSTPQDLDHFIKFQWEIYKGDPHWVAPLFMERRDFLDPQKNPFFDNGTIELFLARRHGQVVGRVAAIEDRNYNAFHGEKNANFGFFETIEDADVAEALLAKVEEFAKQRGLNRVMGPASPNSNYEWGLLVDGFGSDPSVQMPYNPTYYASLIEGAGYQKAKDLWAFHIDIGVDPDPKVVRIADKIRERESVTIRHANIKDFNAELERIKRVYNLAWEKNWGFVPFTDREFEHLAKDMKSILKPELLLIAEVKGEPVAFSMTLPNANEVLKRLNGRLFPFGLFKALYYQSRIKTARLVTLGIIAQYRKRGLDAILTLETLRAARSLGYKTGEISWTLEDNHLVNRAIELFGCHKYKTYRVYDKAVAS
jgi:GNAT superfamily N-acetyltransferase